VITENKMNALNKMLVEMNKTHSSTEDSIHNWLCKQEDESLFTEKGFKFTGKQRCNGR